MKRLQHLLSDYLDADSTASLTRAVRTGVRALRGTFALSEAQAKFIEERLGKEATRAAVDAIEAHGGSPEDAEIIKELLAESSAPAPPSDNNKDDDDDDAAAPRTGRHLHKVHSDATLVHRKLDQKDADLSDAAADAKTRSKSEGAVAPLVTPEDMSRTPKYVTSFPPGTLYSIEADVDDEGDDDAAGASSDKAASDDAQAQQRSNSNAGTLPSTSVASAMKHNRVVIEKARNASFGSLVVSYSMIR